MYMYCIYPIYMLMRFEKEGRKKQARSKQTTKQSNTAHPSLHVHVHAALSPLRPESHLVLGGT